MAKPSRKAKSDQTVSGSEMLDLPLLSDRLKIKISEIDEFEIPYKKEYDRDEGLKGDDSPPLKGFLPDYKPDDFLGYFVANAEPADHLRAAEELRALRPDLFDAFAKAKSAKALAEGATENLPAVAPALWEERTTGREVSPADFIRKHYAQWLGKGLTRAHIGQLDEKLYAAYARQISRSPDKAIAELPTEPRQKRSDPDEALDRIRAQTRASVARSRKAM